MMIRRQMTLCWVAFCSTCGMLLLACGEARTQNQGGQVEQIVAKMQERREQVRSVRYMVRGKGMTAKGVFAADMSSSKISKTVPEKDHHFDISLSWLIDFEKNRLRKEYSGQVLQLDIGKFIPNRYIHVYDGSGSKRLFPRDENTSNDYAPPGRSAELGIIKNGNNVDMDITDFPVFLAHGVIPTSRHPIEGSEQFRRPLEAADYQVRDRAVLRGKACSILRTTPLPEQNRFYEELWVESGRGVVLREDSFFGGELYVRTDIEYQGDNLASWVTTEFKNSAGQATSPGQPRKVSSVAGQIVRVSRFTVQEFEVNPVLEAKNFDVTMKPGMNVRMVDAKAKLETEFDRKEYRVASDGKTLQDLVDGKVVRRWPLLLIVSAGLVLGGAAYLVFWIRKRRKANVTKSNVDRS